MVEQTSERTLTDEDIESNFRTLTVCGKQWPKFITESQDDRSILTEEFCAFTEIERGPQNQKKAVRALFGAGRVEAVCAAIAHHVALVLTRIRSNSLSPTAQQMGALDYHLNSILKMLELDDSRVESRLKKQAVDVSELTKAITEINLHDPDFRQASAQHIQYLEKVRVRLRRYNDLMREASEMPGRDATAAAVLFLDNDLGDGGASTSNSGKPKRTAKKEPSFPSERGTQSIKRIVTKGKAWPIRFGESQFMLTFENIGRKRMF